MSYARFRTGMNTVDVEGINVAKVLALERIAKALEAILKQLEQKGSPDAAQE